MKYIVGFIFSSILFINHLKAQDTLILKSDYVILGGDTLNKYNKENNKQGTWIEFRRSQFIYINHGENLEKADWVLDSTLYPSHYEIELKGNYHNNKKEGKWSAYYKNGQLRKKIFFTKGQINGNFYTYYNNGQIKIKGTQISDNVFEIKTYFENGKLKDNCNYSKEKVIKIF